MSRAHGPSEPSAPRLLARGGFDVFEGLIDATARRQLLAEALRGRDGAQPTSEMLTDREDWRGGNPARRFRSSAGGAVQDAVYTSSWLRRFLRDTTGSAVVPLGTRGSFTYYDEPGAHLALHRDVVGCDVAVITCLRDTCDTTDAGGALTLYPSRIAEPLSVIRRTASRGRVPLRLRSGHTLVILGGHVPHAVRPVGADQTRIVSVLCYRFTSETGRGRTTSDPI